MKLEEIIARMRWVDMITIRERQYNMVWKYMVINVPEKLKKKQVKFIGIVKQGNKANILVEV